LPKPKANKRLMKLLVNCSWDCRVWHHCCCVPIWLATLTWTQQHAVHTQFSVAGRGLPSEAGGLLVSI